MINNKKGDFTGLIFFIVNIVIFAIFLLVVGYIVPQINDGIKGQIGINTDINNSIDASTAVAENTFPTLWLIMFGGLMLGLFATSFFINTHPIFVPIYIFLLVVAVTISVPLSNAYEELAENATLAGAATQQGLIVFIMTNLPLITFIVGLVTLIIAFAKTGEGGVTLG